MIKLSEEQTIQKAFLLAEQLSDYKEVQITKFAEYDKGLEKIIETLEKIQNALLGEIGGISPGLLEEIRMLKKEVETLRGEFSILQQQFQNCQLHTKSQICADKQEELEIIPIKSVSSQKMIWIMTGAGIVIWYILDHFVLDKIWNFLTTAPEIK